LTIIGSKQSEQSKNYCSNHNGAVTIIQRQRHQNIKSSK